MKREILPALILLTLACLIAYPFFGPVDDGTVATLAVESHGVESTLADSTNAGGDWIARAAEHVYELPPLAARLRFKIELFDQLIAGPGSYYQKGQGTRLSRIEFQFGAEDNSVRLNQLSNGDFLYNLTTAFGETSLEFVDLRKLKSLPVTQRKDLSGWLSVGSLPGLLKQLALHFDFAEPQADELDGVRVVRLVGTWKPAALTRLLEGQIDPSELQGDINWQALPAQLPHRVRVTLGDDDRFPGFPYQIIFEQYELQSRRLVAKPIVTLELYELKTARDLPDEMFALPSTDARPQDITDFYRDRILQFTR